MPEKVTLTIPLRPETVGLLRSGDRVTVRGTMLTGGMRLHEYLHTVKPELPQAPNKEADSGQAAVTQQALTGGILFQCEPLIISKDGALEVLTASPANSMYFERFIVSIVERYGLRAVMGKGGMSEDTLKALRERNCIYLHTISGAGVYLAKRVKTVSPASDIFDSESTSNTTPHADDSIFSWYFTVEDFPAIVTSALTGVDMHSNIREASVRNSAKAGCS